MSMQEIGLQRHETGRREAPGACCTGAAGASSATRCGMSGVLDHARRRAADARPQLLDVTRDLFRCTTRGA